MSLFSGTHFWCVSPNDGVFMAKFKNTVWPDDFFFFNPKLLSCVPWLERACCLKPLRHVLPTLAWVLCTVEFDCGSIKQAQRWKISVCWLWIVSMLIYLFNEKTLNFYFPFWFFWVFTWECRAFYKTQKSSLVEGLSNVVLAAKPHWKIKSV